MGRNMSVQSVELGEVVVRGAARLEQRSQSVLDRGSHTNLQLKQVFQAFDGSNISINSPKVDQARRWSALSQISNESTSPIGQ